MTFQEFLVQIQLIPCEETRAQESNYLEVVVAKSNWTDLLLALQTYFGMPLKPEGELASEEAWHYAEPYGGIYENQTLYYRKNDRNYDIALLWPWGNGTMVTVKIVEV